MPEGNKISGRAISKRVGSAASPKDDTFHPQGRSRRGTRAWFVAVLLTLAGFAMQPQAAGAEFGEFEVKAAFLSSFAQFTKWPSGTFSDAGAPFVIGILGDDPFGHSLEGIIQGRAVSGRKVVIRRGRNANDMRGCQIVYISGSERGRLGGIIASLQGIAILTVGETEQFTRQGGVIGFKMEGEKVRFDINASAAKRAGLQISSRLLKIASDSP